jgi:cryptochrome
MPFKHDPPSPGRKDISATIRVDKESTYAKISGPNGDFAVPTMEELGLPSATTPHRGGETEALRALEELLKREEYVATFAKPDTAPTAVKGPATTLLSPHLHFGSLSVREMYWRVNDVVEKVREKGKRVTEPPTSLLGQLLFREMYFGAQEGLGDVFGQMLGNRTVRFIPWHLPTVYDENTGLSTGKYAIDSDQAEQWFRRWKYGRTGFPWIDGLMRQLKEEGWIHHLGRHAVACFLTRGGAYIDWERGAEVFADWLLDHEPACNAGNWQWLSCTAFFSQYFRIYSPISFPQKWDKEGEFIRKWVPELARFDKKYIYEPWKAPIADQRGWGCIIKGNGDIKDEQGTKVYPKPMFDFSERRKICLEAMKKAYDIGLHGDDKRVGNGSWRELFDDDSKGPTKGQGVPGAMLFGSHITDIDVDAAENADGTEESQEPEQEQIQPVPKRKVQGTLDGIVKRSKK